ncbi:MAG: SDR family oxidoreductase [Candidatus Aminicenantes bacterium]|jgi:UDP-glucose 4-epimerase
MNRYLVTGGAGFIGSHIAEHLAAKGFFVRVVDNFLTGKEENIAAFLDGIELVRGDIRDLELCREALKDIDYVLHQAALPSVPRSVENPLLTNAINIEGTLNILLASKDASVKKVVFASSSSVYGDDEHLPKKEGLEGNPLSPYAVTKQAGEKYCQVFSEIYGLPTVCLRYFNVFGPRQDPFSEYAAVIPNFITRLLSDKAPIVYGDGEQSRDFTYIANVVEANLQAAHAPGVSGQVLNLGNGVRTSVNDLAKIIMGLTKKNIEPLHEEERPGDVRHSFADISKARTLLEYTPRVSIEDGLLRTIDWFRNQQ